MQQKNTSMLWPSYGPHKKLSRAEEMNNFARQVELVKEKKFVCSLDLIINVFQARCQTPGCSNACTDKYHFIGTTLIVTCSCVSGHHFKFCSSHDVNGIYANNLQAAASVLLSGNNFAKIERLADFYGLTFLSSSSYYRMQRLYLIPAINEWWFWMRELNFYTELKRLWSIYPIIHTVMYKGVFQIQFNSDCILNLSNKL